MSRRSEIKLLWHKKYRFYKRSAEEVFKLVDEYTRSATDGALCMQGEHLILAAFARRRFLLVGEELRDYGGRNWTLTKHDLDFILERDGTAYGIEVKNTLGYLDLHEFVTKVRLSRHIGVTPIFAVRALPKTWVQALVHAGGYAMIMRYQFYPWTHKELAGKIRTQLQLPVDTPRRIEAGTMQRFENWIAGNKGQRTEEMDRRCEQLLARLEAGYDRKAQPQEGLTFESE